MRRYVKKQKFEISNFILNLIMDLYPETIKKSPALASFAFKYTYIWLKSPFYDGKDWENGGVYEIRMASFSVSIIKIKNIFDS